MRPNRAMAVELIVSPTPCVLCGGTGFRRWAEAERISRIEGTGRRVVTCESCGLSRLEPLPTAAELEAFYASDDYLDLYSERPDIDYVAGNVEAAPFVDERLMRLRESLGGQVGSILDVGAARGAFLARARSYGWRVEGLELSAKGVAAAREQHGIELRQTTLEKAGFAGESFDAVHMSHVLEHVADPLATVREIARVLKPGGVMILEVPNEFIDLFDSVQAVVQRKERDAYVVVSPHVYFFNPQSLPALVRAAGFDVLRTTTPRRNRHSESRLPMGGVLKKFVYAAEPLFRRGPLIELFARKPVPWKSFPQ